MSEANPIPVFPSLTGNAAYPVGLRTMLELNAANRRLSHSARYLGPGSPLISGRQALDPCLNRLTECSFGTRLGVIGGTLNSTRAVWKQG